MLRTLEELLLQLSLGNLDLDSLVDLLLVPALVVGVVLDRGGEERVDEGGLAQPGLASNLVTGQNKRQPLTTGTSDHNSEGGTPLRDNLVPLVGQIGNANGRRALGSGRSHLELSIDRNEIKVGEGIKNVQPKPWRVQLGEMLLGAEEVVDVLELTGTRRRGRELVLQGNLPIKFPDQRSCRARISEQARTASGQWTDGRASRSQGARTQN